MITRARTNWRALLRCTTPTSKATPPRGSVFCETSGPLHDEYSRGCRAGYAGLCLTPFDLLCLQHPARVLGLCFATRLCSIPVSLGIVDRVVLEVSL